MSHALLRYTLTLTSPEQILQHIRQAMRRGTSLVDFESFMQALKQLPDRYRTPASIGLETSTRGVQHNQQIQRGIPTLNASTLVAPPTAGRMSDLHPRSDVDDEHDGEICQSHKHTHKLEPVPEPDFDPDPDPFLHTSRVNRPVYMQVISDSSVQASPRGTHPLHLPCRFPQGWSASLA